MADLNANKVKKDKKRRRRNYDDIDNQVQKIEEDTKINKTTIANPSAPRALDEVDSDDLNDDELDRLMLLEEEKEKLLNKSKPEEEEVDDDSEESFELSAVEDVPVTRRTRGKVIDYTKTAEELSKEEGDDAEKEYVSDDDAEYVPEE